MPCRGALAAAKRRAFVGARKVAVDDALRRGLFNPVRRGGRWGEKLLTLTLPHFRNQSIAERIQVACVAWTLFLRKLHRFWKARDVQSAAWFRVLEWTLGNDDNCGHPHFHIWILSPFIPHEEIERWWREAVVEASGDTTIARVIVDIREVHAAGAEHELIKYLTKDITANGEKIAPEIYAAVYKALDGRRNTQASRGFMAKGARKEERCECGSLLPKRVRRVPKAKPDSEP